MAFLAERALGRDDEGSGPSGSAASPAARQRGGCDGRGVSRRQTTARRRHSLPSATAAALGTGETRPRQVSTPSEPSSCAVDGPGGPGRRAGPAASSRVSAGDRTTRGAGDGTLPGGGEAGPFFECSATKRGAGAGSVSSPARPGAAGPAASSVAGKQPQHHREGRDRVDSSSAASAPAPATDVGHGTPPRSPPWEDRTAVVSRDASRLSSGAATVDWLRSPERPGQLPRGHGSRGQGSKGRDGGGGSAEVPGSCPGRRRVVRRVPDGRVRAGGEYPRSTREPHRDLSGQDGGEIRRPGDREPGPLSAFPRDWRGSGWAACVDADGGDGGGVRAFEERSDVVGGAVGLEIGTLGGVGVAGGLTGKKARPRHDR